ncbi:MULTISPECIES: patatin-like phospholipase family protein [Geobacillus]|uniref:Esterase n=1 Tax=Geobacillus thermocatenulatus TaxID=33938 RepID=A0AA91TD04_9BACL|nr:MULTISPECIES: patatin-like phospholipase family protein [Geobacillus]KPD01257.1 NTE family protein RssA [Geobacillus sp. BCO2]OXB86427.1 esterase [Geobacillus thermocatenulatus]RAN29906.1 esterase [Geobacillus sp. A8]
MPPKVGLALGSGGARGFAHLGVLKVLEEEHIPISYLAGSSIGALVAVLYASGHGLHRLYRLAQSFRRNDFLDWTVPKMGLIAGERITQFLRLLTKGKRIEEMSPPVAVVAADLRTGEKVVFRQGEAAQAVRASISIPGIFVPAEVNGRLLVDGGVVDRVPVSVARAMGADIVIAVDVSPLNTKAEIASIADVIWQSLDILQAELVAHRQLASDVMIRPRVEQYSSRAFTDIEEIIARGEEEARKQVGVIRQAIEQWKESSHE